MWGRLGGWDVGGAFLSPVIALKQSRVVATCKVPGLPLSEHLEGKGSMVQGGHCTSLHEEVIIIREVCGSARALE